MTDCIFCRIANREIPVDLILETDTLVAFHDLNPQAPQHVLLIPKKHIATLDGAGDEDRAILGDLLLSAAEIARRLGFSEAGYRTVINCNQNGGQSVYHLHVHLLGGRALHWPPG
jgi:histidine triad (HIT) family protein